MKMLVAWASQHGATREIAERIAERLRAAGHEAASRSVAEARDIADYEAFVVGSAVYIGHWQKDAVKFVLENGGTLRERPTWLFSSGPLGPKAAEGRDVREAAERNEIAMLRDAARLQEAVRPREHRAFFGALRPDRLSFAQKLIRATPAGRKLMPEGDFRDWTEIEAWADSIAHELSRVPAGVGASA